VITQRVESLVQADYLILILNVLGRLRGFEDHLRVIEENFHDQERPTPAFDRLSRPRKPAEPNLDEAKDGHLIEITFDPFQAEDLAEFELVIGLSRPLRQFEVLRESPPKLRLFKDNELIETPYLRFDKDLSTQTMLVYRIPMPRLRIGALGAGKYTPKLLIDRKYMPILSRDNTINFTFSVATPRPNVQLIAGLRQPQPKEGDRELEKDKEYAFRGTIPANVGEAIIEVEVLAGAPVVNSNVTGVFQRIDQENDPIDNPTLQFLDDGLFPDLKRDDGIYTARITVKPAAERQPAEYRVYIQAQSTDKDAYIPLAEPIPKPDTGETKQEEPKPPPVPKYQRATSLNFRVSGDS
jgi:hypothetical protein